MRCVGIALVMLAVLLVNASADASIEGDSIAGVINFSGGPTNYFDPVNGFVPATNSGIQPGAVVTSADGAYVEFEYLNGFSGFHVDVDAATVSINQFPVSSGGGAASWDIWITGIDWNGGPGGITGITEISDTFNGGGAVTAAYTTDSLHFTYGGGTLSSSGATAVYQLSGSAIPEPSTVVIWSLLASVGLAVGWRRRRKAG